MPYSMSKAAKVAGVSKTTMHKWVKSGKVTSTKLNDGTYSIEESELTRVIESRKQVTSTTVIQPVNTGNISLTSEPLNLSIYRSNTLNEVKYAAALEAVSHERKLLRQQVNELRQRAEAAEARSEAAAERYHDSIKTITKLLEDKREAPQRKKFLGIF
jgi:predicted site-specific integrase-resolvase